MKIKSLIGVLCVFVALLLVVLNKLIAPGVAAILGLIAAVIFLIISFKR